MKSSILKFILPVAAFALASAAAVGTPKGDDAAALFRGHRLTGNPQQPCEYVKMCSDIVNPICTVDGTPTGQRLWRQAAEGSPCNITVYEP